MVCQQHNKWKSATYTPTLSQHLPYNNNLFRTHIHCKTNLQTSTNIPTTLNKPRITMTIHSSLPTLTFLCPTLPLTPFSTNSSHFQKNHRRWTAIHNPTDSRQAISRCSLKLPKTSSLQPLNLLQGGFAIPLPLAAVPISAGLALILLTILTILRTTRDKNRQQRTKKLQGNQNNPRSPPEIGIFELWSLGRKTPGFKENRLAVLTTIEKKYGQVFVLRFGGLGKVTVASGSDAIRGAVRSRESVLAFETNLKLADRINHVHNEKDVGLATKNYPRRLKMTGKIGSDFGKMSRILTWCEEPIMTETRSELRRWAQDCSDGGSVVLHEVMSRAVIRIALNTFIGPEFAKAYGDAFWKAFAEWEGNAYSVPWLAFPRTARTLNRNIGRNFAKFSGILKDWLHTVEASPELMPAHSYLKILWERQDVDMRSALAGHIVAILIAVHINTASSGAWTIAQTLRNEDFLADAQKECQTYQFKQWNDDQAMPTMTMIFHEALRYYFNSMAMREVRKDFRVGDIVVPGDGGLILLSVMSSHRDPKFYPSPDTFVHDRFRDSKFLAHATDSKKLMLWGGGPHMCPGRFMATSILRAIWSELFKSYNVSLLNDLLPEQTWGSVGTSSPQSPIRIRISERRKQGET